MARRCEVDERNELHLCTPSLKALPNREWRYSTHPTAIANVLFAQTARRQQALLDAENMPLAWFLNAAALFHAAHRRIFAIAY